MASKAQRRAIIAKHNGVCDHCKKKGSQVPPPFHHKHHPPKSFPTIYSDNVFDLRGGGKPLILDYQLLSIPRMRVWLAMFVFTRIVARPTVARHRAPALALAPPWHPLLLHLPRAPRPRPPFLGFPLGPHHLPAIPTGTGVAVATLAGAIVCPFAPDHHTIP